MKKFRLYFLTFAMLLSVNLVNAQQKVTVVGYIPAWSLNWQVYPNPAPGNKLSISANDNQLKGNSLVNNIGQVVKRNGQLFSGTQQIDVSGISSGIYFLTIQSKTATQQIKVVIK